MKYVDMTIKETRRVILPNEMDMDDAKKYLAGKPEDMEVIDFGTETTLHGAEESLTADYNFDTGLFHVRFETGDGGVMNKALTPMQMIDFLQKGSDTRVSHLFDFPAGFCGGNFTEGEITGEVLFARQGVTSPLVYRVEKSGKDIVFDDFPWPNILYRVIVIDGRVRRVYAYVYFGELSVDSGLYRFPLGNVYEDGHICMGNQITVKSFAELNRVPMVFSSAPFNNDLYHLPMPQGELIKKIVENGFKKEELAELTSYGELKEMIEARTSVKEN